LEPIDLLEHGLLNHITLEEFFLVGFFDKIMVNLTSCSEVEEERYEEDDRLENSLGEADNTFIALEALPI